MPNNLHADNPVTLSGNKARNFFISRFITTIIATLLPIFAAQSGQLPQSAFQTYNASNAGSITAGPFSLYTVPVASLHPTQMDEGLAEVSKKTAGTDLLSTTAALNTYLLGYIEPVVIGPGGVLYLTDGHHTFTALLDSTYGASNPNVYVNVIANYSSMTTAQFYATMQANNLLLPLNNGQPQTVNLNTGSPIPTSLTSMLSDVYRGLEYSILKNKSSTLFPTSANITGAVGAASPGLDKMTGAYADFLEATAYRDAKNGLGLPYLTPGDIAIATSWNLNPNSTTTIPNINGTVTAAQLPGFILAQNIVNAGGISNTTLANGAMDGNGTFTGITTVNLGTASTPITIGVPNTGFIMQLGADLKNTVTLNGTNSYTGGTSIIAGTLIAQSDASLGAPTPSGAVIDPANVKASVQAANGIVFNSLTEGNGTLTLGTTTGGTFSTNRPIAVDGEVATINVNNNTVSLTGQLISLGTNGVGIGNATGMSDLTIDDLSSAGTGKLTLSTASPYFYGNLIIGNSGTPTVTVMNDAALGNTTGAAYMIGQINLNGGTLQAGASFAAPERNMFLGGGSNIDVNGFSTSWGSLSNTQRTLDILNSNTTTAGAITFNNMVISATATLQLAGGTAGESVTFTNGISRTAGDTLILQGSSTTSLGTTEKVFNGVGAASLVNGIAPVWIVTNNGVTKSGGPYDFVSYGSNGYVKATYGSVLNGTTGNSVVLLGANTTPAGNAAAFALNTNGKTLSLGSNTLTLGDGTNAAGLIMAGGSSISGGTLAFGGSEGVIWLSGASTISSAITGSNASTGLTFAGSGSVTLNNAVNVAGLITIDSGTVTLGGANIVSTDLAGVLLDNTKTKPAPATLGITANNTLTTLNTVGNNSAIKLSNGATLTIGDSVNNLSSSIVATLTETGTPVAGALTVNGSGLIDFSTASKGALNLVAGSTVVVNNSAQLRVAGNAFANATTQVVLNGTSQLQVAANGGQILANPITGTGALRLIGGTLQITGTTNSYSGGTFVETGSILDITTANLPTANPNITNAGGQVLFDQTTSGTYAGVISDGLQMGIGPMLSGIVVKDDSTGANSGNVTFTQAQTYTGQTTIEAGTITLNAANTLAASAGIDLGRVGGGATAGLILGANNAIQALTDEAGNTTSVSLGSYNLTITNATGSFGGVISGTGALAVTGGAQTLAGINSYSGATSISSGASLALTGTGSIAASSGLSNAGTFDISATTAGASLTALTGAGGVTLGAQTLSITNAAGSYSGVMAGTGGLAMLGGSQTLAGVNSYSGATTIASGASLLLSGSGAIAGSSGLANAGTFDISGTASGATIASLTGAGGVTLGGKTLTLTSASGSFSGTIAGAGGITVAGGTQTLTGSNSYTGATLINPGATLALTGTGAISASSGVIDNGTFSIAGANAGATITTLSGTGTLALGSQTLTLSNATSSFGGKITGTGALAVSGGSQTLSGSNTVGTLTIGNNTVVSNTGSLTSTGPITIASGGFFTNNGTLTAPSLSVSGTLRGTGLVNAPTNVTGRLAPRNSPGTITFTAPVTLAAGSTSEFDIDGTGTGTGAGNYSRVLVTGASYTAGGTLLPLLRGITGSASNTYTPPIGQQFQVVAATGGVLGSFAGLTQPTGLAAGTRLDAIYQPTSLNLVVTPSAYGNLALAGLSETNNAGAVGKVIDAQRPAAGIAMSSTQAAFYDPLYVLSANAIAPVLQQMAPTIYADGLIAGRQSWYAASNSVTDQITARRNGTVAGQTAPGPDGTTIWTTGMGQFTDVNANGATGYKVSLGGALAGIDAQISPDAVIGFAAGGSSLTTSGNGGTDTGTAVQLSIYGGAKAGIAFADGQLAYVNVNENIRRSMSLTSSSITGQDTQAGIGAQIHFGVHLDRSSPWGNSWLEPMVGLTVMTLNAGAAAETTGGVYAERVGNRSLASVESLVAVRLGTVVNVGGSPLSLRGLAG